MPRRTTAAGPGGGAAADNLTVSTYTLPQAGAAVQAADMILAWATLTLLRLARRCALLRPRRPGYAWPGRGHAFTTAALLSAEVALDSAWTPAASLRLDRAIALFEAGE